MTPNSFRWGILGAGNIAGAFARDLPSSRWGRLHAVGSRSLEKAEAFVAKHGGEAKAYGSYEDLLADPEVQAVYIATPHPEHVEWAIRAAEAGKHLLVEKPLAMNFAEGMAIAEAAHQHGVLLLEAFMYRFLPATQELVNVLRSGVIGEVQLIEVHFAFRTKVNPEGRLFAPALGGGGILDVGCYTTSMARLVAGAARGLPFADPKELKAFAHIGSTGVDEWSTAVLDFGGGLLAQLSCGVRVKRWNGLQVWGTEGSITWPDFWFNRGPLTITSTREGASRTIIPATDRGLYSWEADAVAEHHAAGEAPGMTVADTLGNLRTLDQWRAAVNLTYPREQPGTDWRPVPGRALRQREPVTMPYGHLPGIPQGISRLVMGVDNQPHVPHMTVMFDDFVERGGNCFDCSYIYAGGRLETRLGWWLKHRGDAFRNDIVLLDKGAHTPFCWPHFIASEIPTSVERLQTGWIDLYMMHRDNPEVPVGEFIDVLNRMKQQGLIRAFGASNWTKERFDEANAWAAAHGLEGFVATSNNFSLARMVDPVWAGCIAASSPRYRAWHIENQVPNFAWSSQARGFFTDRAGPDRREDAELARCWYADDNFARRDRAFELARQRGVLPINIALAYVLAQPFPQWALIGPRQLSETRTTWPALEVTLTPTELHWLDTGE